MHCDIAPPSASGDDRLLKLDCLRGFAALYVFLGHLLPSVMPAHPLLAMPFRFGQEAVILFFLISGFVIYYSCENNSDKSFFRYFTARLKRIYPIFLLSLLLAGSSNPDADATSWRNLVGNLLMLQDFDYLKPGVWFNVFAGNDPLWSLSYEWWFYFGFFALHKYIPTERRGMVALSVSIAGVISFGLAANQISLFATYFVIWWAGTEIARAHLARQRLPWQAIALLSVQAVVLLFPVAAALNGGSRLVFGAHPFLELRHVLFAIVSLLLAMCWQRLDWRGFRAIFGPFRPIAPISYGLYVTHFPIVTWVGPGRGLAGLLAAVLLCMIAAVFAEKLYQKSVLRLLACEFWLPPRHVSAKSPTP